jgi:tRNA nucleotidyltransferase (CCA-adding enzyme)
MKIYLVGGAVRDMALGLPVKERDWVVVGSTPKALLDAGFKQVGRDFPVFLHPQTQEEYALARKERKIGAGYTGFSCEFEPSISLEEDLLRRDLTINAIAIDENGTWIDPFGGLEDIRQRVLRHVSPAFVEDPVRVLRVARFAARFAHLGFRVCDETKTLMYTMSKHDELNALVAERVWREWENALRTKHPEVFIRVLRETDALTVIFPEIAHAFGIPKNRLNPEMIVDVGESALVRLSNFSERCEDPILRFAVFFLEFGKVLTSASYWPFHPNECIQGKQILSSLGGRLKIPNVYLHLTQSAMQSYQAIAALFSLTAEDILQVLQHLDAWRRFERFEKILNVAEAYHLHPLLTECWLALKRNTTDLPLSFTQDYQGEALKNAIRMWRLENIQRQLIAWGKNEA